MLSKNTFGLYRDDGLAVIKGLSGSEIEKLKKSVVITFKDCVLNIMPYGVDVLHRPASHPIFSYWVD